MLKCFVTILPVTRCRRGGTIEMTLVLLCVILSACVSIIHLVPKRLQHLLLDTSEILKIFFYFLYMRMYTWYWIFDPIISDIIRALVNYEIAIFKACVHNSFYIFNWILLKFRMLSSLYEDLRVVLNCWAYFIQSHWWGFITETGRYGPYSKF